MRPRRAIRTVLVYALLGAVATVLTSWAIQTVQFGEMQRIMPTQFLPRFEPVLRDREWTPYRLALDGSPAATPTAFEQLAGEQRDRLGWRLRVGRANATTVVAGREVRTAEVLVVVDSGLPALAMRAGVFRAADSSTPMFRQAVHAPRHALRSGLMLHAPSPGNFLGDDRLALPLLPLWPGFLLNTCLYAILTFALVRAPRVLRRGLRRRRGRCVGCGYDRAGLDALAACPECGAQPPPRRATAAARAT
jgi:hypothetical protein